MSETVDDYLAGILARIRPTEAVKWDIHDVMNSQSFPFGAALAESMTAKVDLPLWNASAMDGYALLVDDVQAATAETPVLLQVVGEVAAGDSFDPEIRSGTAVRIMTGAPVPSVATAVVPIELTRGGPPPEHNNSDKAAAKAATDAGADANRGDWSDGSIWVQHAVASGANIRRRGEDVTVGDPIASAGEALNAARLSALAAAGISRVLLHRLPRIAVVSTGTELRPAGSTLRRGEIPESNSYLLTGLLHEMGMPATTIEHCADSAQELKARLAEIAANHDVIITTGGVGPGKYDVVRIALEDEPEIRSVRVRVRPGQPQCSGRHSNGAFVFGLPGNPVSAAVSFELFVRPALRTMAGHSRIHRRTLNAIVQIGWVGKAGSLQVLPVTLTSNEQGLLCAPAVPPHGVSHAVGRYGAADGFALVEPERDVVLEGELVRVIETGPA